MTVTEFMSRGAAFGIQILQATEGDSEGEELAWDNTATFLLNKVSYSCNLVPMLLHGKYCQLIQESHQDRSEPFKIETSGNDEMKIVCDPFFGTKKRKKFLSYTMCYDVLPLGKPDQGIWTFKLSMVERKKGIHLCLHRSTKLGRRVLKQDFEFPLYVDRGSNCLHVGLDGHDPEPYLEPVTTYSGTKKAAQSHDTPEPDIITNSPGVILAGDRIDDCSRDSELVVSTRQGLLESTMTTARNWIQSAFARKRAELHVDYSQQPPGVNANYSDVFVGQAKGKRKTCEMSGGTSGDEDQRPAKRQSTTGKTGGQNEANARYACPFFQRDKEKWRSHKACVRNGFKNMTMLKYGPHSSCHRVLVIETCLFRTQKASIRQSRAAETCLSAMWPCFYQHTRSRDTCSSG